MAARQFGHCSSDEFAIGRTAPQAAHRDTVCLASMPPLLGASAGLGGGGDGRRGSGFGLRDPCWRDLRSLMAGEWIVGAGAPRGAAPLAPPVAKNPGPTAPARACSRPCSAS